MVADEIGGSDRGGGSTQRSIAETLIKDLVSQAGARFTRLDRSEEDSAYRLATGRSPYPNPNNPSQRSYDYLLKKFTEDSLRDQLRSGCVAGAALTLTHLGMAQQLAGSLPDRFKVQFDIGQRIAWDTTGDLEDLATELSPDGTIHGVFELVIEDEDEDGEEASTWRREALPPQAKFLLAKAVDASALTLPGWTERYQAQVLEMLFPVETDPFLEEANEADEDADGRAIATRSTALSDEVGDKSAAVDFDGGLSAQQQAVEPATVEAEPTLNRNGFVSLGALMRGRLPPRDYVIYPFAERGRVSLVFGEPGCSKTTLMVHLGLSVALGKNWGPFTVKAPGKVLWVNGEESPDEANRRWSGAARAAAVGSGEPETAAIVRAVDQVSIWGASGALRIAERRSGEVSLTTRGERLFNEVRTYQPDLLVVDPLATAHSLDEQSNADMADFFALLQDVAHETGVAVVFVHHSRKGSKSGDAGMDDARGSSAIAGAVRSMWRLHRQADGMVELKCVKANNFNPPEPVMFRLQSVRIRSGDEVASIVLESAPDGDQATGTGSRPRAGRGKPGAKPARAPTTQR